MLIKLDLNFISTARNAPTSHILTTAKKRSSRNINLILLEPFLIQLRKILGENLFFVIAKVN